MVPHDQDLDGDEPWGGSVISVALLCRMLLVPRATQVLDAPQSQPCGQGRFSALFCVFFFAAHPVRVFPRQCPHRLYKPSRLWPPPVPSMRTPKLGTRVECPW